MILTSRPNAVEDKLRDKFNLIIENEGFSDSDKDNYIEKCFDGND